MATVVCRLVCADLRVSLFLLWLTCCLVACIFPVLSPAWLSDSLPVCLLYVCLCLPVYLCMCVTYPWPQGCSQQTIKSFYSGTSNMVEEYRAFLSHPASLLGQYTRTRKKCIQHLPLSTTPPHQPHSAHRLIVPLLLILCTPRNNTHPSKGCGMDS